MWIWLLRDRAPHPAPFSNPRKHAKKPMFSGVFAFSGSSPFRPIPPHKMHESSPYHPQGFFPVFAPCRKWEGASQPPQSSPKAAEHRGAPSRPVSDIVDGMTGDGASVDTDAALRQRPVSGRASRFTASHTPPRRPPPATPRTPPPRPTGEGKAPPSSSNAPPQTKARSGKTLRRTERRCSFRRRH